MFSSDIFIRHYNVESTWMCCIYVHDNEVLWPIDIRCGYNHVKIHGTNKTLFYSIRQTMVSHTHTGLMWFSISQYRTLSLVFYIFLWEVFNLSYADVLDYIRRVMIVEITFIISKSYKCLRIVSLWRIIW